MGPDLIKIRYPAVAGMFYPADSQNLSRSINAYLSDADALLKQLNLPQTPPKAFIVPHAGYIYSGLIAGSAYNLLQKFCEQRASATPLKILLLGLSHQVLLNGAAVSTAEEWETPFGNVKSKNLLKEIRAPQNVLVESDEAHEPEHSLEVQLPFLQTVLKNFTIYPIAISDVDPEKLADALADFCAQNDVLIIVSSDLSHYLPYAQAQKKDRASLDAILSLDITRAEKELNACNKTGILTLMHIAQRLNLKPHLLDYRNSGDTAGNKSAVVGYASVAFGDRPQSA